MCSKWPLARVGVRCENVLLDIAAHAGASLSDGAPLFEILCELTARALQIEPQATLDLLQHRLASLTGRASLTSGIMEVDMGAACLDLRDRDEVKRMQKDFAAKEAETTQFATEYKARRAKGRSEGAKQPGQRKGKKQSIPWEGTKVMPPPSGILQADVRQLMSPGTLVPAWLALGVRSSSPLRVAAGAGANGARPRPSDKCFRTLGRSTYLDVSGRPREDCPLSGDVLSIQRERGAAVNSLLSCGRYSSCAAARTCAP